ncbi:MAG: hypothetical protein M0R33_22880 [Methylomonas sp.]|uniref:hypothetical protein n=1 Tax=Methylomonas sp. TaxID=418 RepID=UPI0025EC2CA3|nr:hypothetical protein [Methylomonas sp.]MCK9609288.1 hypothetical protein [Methylomonas sp.]
MPILLMETDWRDLRLADIQGTPDTWISSAANSDADTPARCECYQNHNGCGFLHQQYP